jgi:hypothetical protein
VEGFARRVALLLEQTAHQGVLALRLLLQAGDLQRVADDPAVPARLAELESRLIALEREGRARLRQVRRLLRPRRGAGITS